MRRIITLSNSDCAITRRCSVYFSLLPKKKKKRKKKERKKWTVLLFFLVIHSTWSHSSQVRPFIYITNKPNLFWWIQFWNPSQRKYGNVEYLRNVYIYWGGGGGGGGGGSGRACGMRFSISTVLDSCHQCWNTRMRLEWDLGSIKYFGLYQCVTFSGKVLSRYPGFFPSFSVYWFQSIR